MVGPMSWMVSPAALKKMGKVEAMTHPVGTGSFKFVSYRRDISLKFERFAGYLQKGKPYLDRVEFKIIADPVTQMADFMTGDSDIVLNLDIYPKNAKNLEKARKYNIVKKKLLVGVYTLMPDSAHPNSAYANLKVRQAVWHAIDFEAICDTIGYGYWRPLNQYAALGSLGL